MAQLQRMKPEIFVGVIVARAKEKQFPMSEEQLQQLGVGLLNIMLELYADSTCVYCDPTRSTLFQALARQAQQPQPVQQPPVQQPPVQQQPFQQQPQQPARQPVGDINDPTPLPVAATGRLSGTPPAPPQSGLQTNAPHQVPIQAPMLQPAGGNGTQPPASVIDGPGANVPLNPASVDAPPSLTNGPPPPPAFD